MTAQQIGYLIGTIIGIGSIVALVIWVVYTLVKYKPVEIFIRRWEDLKWVIREVGMTLSNKPSLLSSKRIERMLFIIVYVTLTIFWVWHRRNEMNSAEFVMVVSPLMVYAGFNTVNIRKDQQAPKESELTKS